jgi:uncharacterized protein YyaL (SSP411 family)
VSCDGKESFKVAVAKYEQFIKVDREERPDVDQVYDRGSIANWSGGGPNGLSRWKTIFLEPIFLKKTGSKCYIIL